MAVLEHLLAQATPTTTAPGPVVELRGSGAATLVVGVGVVLAVIWWLPVWLDARRAYQLRQRAIDLVGTRLLDAAKKDGLKMNELRELLATIGEPASGQKGLARSLMAFTIITVVGVALAALLLSSAGDAGDLRKTVITSLLTLLGTIVGFYFGTRAAEGGAERAHEEPTPPAAPPTEEPTAPTTGEQAAPVTEEAVTPTEEAAVPAEEEVVPAEEVTPYEGPTEPDQEGAPQPVADAEEDDDPENLGGEELPDDGEELPEEKETP